MQKVNYDNIASDFSNSRIWMKWWEIEYFFKNYTNNIENKNILDIWCGSWRLCEQLLDLNNWLSNFKYTWVDNSAWMLENAKKSFPNSEFLLSDMTNVKFGENINSKFDIITFIASFHHLDNLKDREETLKNTYEILDDNWIVFLTNWALDSEINNEKYLKDQIRNSQNEFGSYDYSIKFWEYARYYHCFNLNELEYLFKKVWFKIVENRLFDNKKNFISILKK